MLKVLIALVLSNGLFNAIKPNQTQLLNQFESDLKRCHTLMQSSKILNFDLTYNAYHSHSSAISAEKAIGKYIHEKDKSYYSLMGNTFIQTKNIFLVKDDSNKVVLIKKTGEFEDPLLKTINFELIRKKITKIDFSEEKNIRIYELTINDPDVVKLKICINSTVYHVSRISMNYKNNFEIINSNGTKSKITPRIDVEYVVSNEKKIQNYFDISGIVKKNKSSWQLIGKYKKYQLIDQYHSTIKK